MQQPETRPAPGLRPSGRVGGTGTNTGGADECKRCAITLSYSSKIIMPGAVRFVLTGLGLAFFAVGFYYRIRAAQSGERLDRTREG